jgi:hypothetical protein
MQCCRRYCQGGCKGYGRTWSKGATPANPSWSWTWLTKARDDDRWHCRQLLRLIAQSWAFHLDEHRRFEEGLLMLLAAIEGGSTEALFWLIHCKVFYETSRRANYGGRHKAPAAIRMLKKDCVSWLPLSMELHRGTWCWGRPIRARFVPPGTDARLLIAGDNQMLAFNTRC